MSSTNDEKLLSTTLGGAWIVKIEAIPYLLRLPDTIRMLIMQYTDYHTCLCQRLVQDPLWYRSAEILRLSESYEVHRDQRGANDGAWGRK